VINHFSPGLFPHLQGRKHQVIALLSSHPVVDGKGEVEDYYELDEMLADDYDKLKGYKDLDLNERQRSEAQQMLQVIFSGSSSSGVVVVVVVVGEGGGEGEGVGGSGGELGQCEANPQDCVHTALLRKAALFLSVAYCDDDHCSLFPCGGVVF